MIRVLHVIDHLGSGGAQTALLNLLKYRDAALFEVTVAAMHGRGQVAAELESIGLRVLSLSPQKWPPAYFGNLWRLLRRERFDVVHCHLFGANWIAKPLAWLAGCRVRFSHDQCNDALRENGVLRIVDHLTNQFSTRILAVSQSIVRFLCEREHLPSRVVEYFPNGVDVAAFPPASPEQRLSARARWSLPADSLVVAGVGRLVPQKDFSTFLQAAAQVRRTVPRARFIIFGEGPEEKVLRAQAAGLGLGDSLTFAGYQSDRGAIYAAADLLFLSSRYEGTPMVLLEAMASRVPIVATGVDGTAEILRHGHSALFFPPGDVASAAAALAKLLRDPSRRVELAAAAYQQVASKFNAERLTRHLETLYERALAPR